MTIEQLRDVAEEVLTQVLVQRVVEKLMERQKQALVVYTGSDIGLAPTLEAMGRLREEGFTFRTLLSRNAAEVLNPEKIRAALRPEALWLERPEETPEALTARYDTILVPAMTVRTASHVAACMADTPAAAVILDGLMRGKRVVINVDGCCPDNPERAKRGFHMADPLRQKLRENMKILRSYGAQLTTSTQFYEKTMEMGMPGFRSKAQPEAEPRKAPQAERPAPLPATPVKSGVITLSMDGRVLSGRHLQGCPDHSTVLVPGETMITQLAADEARRRDICIRKET